MTAVVADLERLRLDATRAPSVALLDAALARYRGAASSKPAAPAALPQPLAHEPAPTSGPVFKPISKYIFDQSGKFVKVYVTLPGIEEVPDERIHLDGSSSRLAFEVLGLPASSPLAPNARL